MGAGSVRAAVFLKTLTLKGFKSFAEATTIELEPGITVVVGPNGSGKSNVVYAVAWVLGAQGPRTVRSSKMEDVIFAGSGRRPALGRAEVALTIDNSSGRLPIGLTEVTITRTLWRSGESEYAINGAPCRLLDVQELLSDSGVGRQQHVIVSQGQLDAVLNSRPEERRLVIEEAAGVLKYRRRRERAERRLASTEGDLDRLQDLLREVRRQIRPLQRQAEAARKYDALVAEHRAVRLHLAGRELAAVMARGKAAEVARAELDAEGRDLRSRLAALDQAVAGAEVSVSAHRVDDLDAAIARLDGLRERGRGLAALVAERRRSVERELAAAVDAGVVASLESEAARVAEDLARADQEASGLEPRLDRLEEDERVLAADRARAEAVLAGEAGDPPGSGRGPAGPEIAGPEIAGPEIAGAEIAGAEIAGAETGGAETGGAETGGAGSAGELRGRLSA
ncbi:MAG: AAA family ATPase, partial [Acidimicrobiales bacterium]